MISILDFFAPHISILLGKPYQAIQPVKMSIFDRQIIVFELELAAYWPGFLHYSWIFESATLIQIVSVGILS